MKACRTRLAGRGAAILFVAAVAVFGSPSSPPAAGDTLSLSNGVRLEGKVGKIAKIVQNPLQKVADANTPILLIDDDLRRVFFPSQQLAVGTLPEARIRNEQRIMIEQVVAPGRRISSVGSIIGVEPFDQYGRRTFVLNSNLGRTDVVQGITEITPRYTKVEALNGFTWDMRIATSSIPRDTLSAIIKNNIDLKDADERLAIVSLYLQSERYRDAHQELLEVLKDFPELKELESTVTSLRELNADRVLDEIKLRRGAGQHRLAYSMAKDFPVGSVEKRLEASEAIKSLDEQRAKGEQVGKLLGEHLGELKDEALREKVRPAAEEIAAELNFVTLDRMADYLRLADDATMTADQKLSLALSGWILGGGVGDRNLAVSLSLLEVRDLARQYLRSPRPHERDEILAKIEKQEGGTPAYLARIIAAMKPPVPTDAEEHGVPGFYRLTTPGLTGEPDIVYYVQLPPEYEPYRRYPCVVTLNGSGTTPPQQVDWWAGSFAESIGQRSGQAARHGYVVIAPVWARDGQSKYEFTAREHAAVLYSLRDAMQRVSIDSDRVFLSGHSMGGDAAWDIGQAHPDLWAGVVPIVAAADKYINLYNENARYVPFYFVCGEMDGDKLAQNALVFDRYFKWTGYDVMVVQYQGRGHEHFHDEVLELFNWMELHKRNWMPKEFECVSMREWDNFFWWVEVDEFPSATMVSPAAFDTRTSTRRAEVKGQLRADNGVTLGPRGLKATIWLSREMVDFDELVIINGRSRTVTPSAQVLLEDVRTRGDRQHPFWAKEPS